MSWGNPPSRPPALGYLARICDEKGAPELVDAFLALRERMPDLDLQLRLAGTTSPDDLEGLRDLRERLRGSGSAAQITSNLTPEKKREHLSRLSVFSVPALYGEAFGLYHLEAMASGVPVVAPRHAAHPEVLEATGGGILYDPDTPGALADAIESLLRDPARAREIGRRGREAVLKNFTAAHMAQRFLAIAEEIVHDAAAARRRALP